MCKNKESSTKRINNDLNYKKYTYICARTKKNNQPLPQTQKSK